MTAAHCVMGNNVVVSQFVLTNPITGNFEFIDVNNIYWDGIGDIALVRTNINFTNYSSYPLKLASINPNTSVILVFYVVILQVLIINHMLKVL